MTVVAKKKLVFDIAEVKEPKSVKNFKRIFLKTDEATLLKLALCMQDAYDVEASDLTLADYQHEIKMLMRGEYGEWCEQASLYYEVNGNIAGAIFTSVYEGKPLLIYVFTRKDFLGEAIASQLIHLSAYILKLLKHKEFLLYIDDRDSESYNLYRVIGFKPEETEKRRK